MKIYWIRHTSVAVPKGTAYGFSDVALSDTFEEEASRTKERLAGLQPDAVFSSPLSRCRRLAAFCGFPNPQCDVRLKELNFGEWEMRTWDEIWQDERGKLWFDQWITTPTPQGESLSQQYERLACFLDELRTKPYHSVCIFAHGGILSCAQVYAGAYTLAEVFQHIPPYGEVVEMEL